MVGSTMRYLLPMALAGYGLWRSTMVRIVRGASMAPTLRSGDIVFARQYRAGRPLPVGSIVILRTRSRALLIKRVTALAGELVAIDQPREGSVLMYNNSQPFIVPRDHVFVLGDNPQSLDSRMIGPIACRDILGVVAATYRRWDRVQPDAPPALDLHCSHLPVESFISA